MKIRTIVATAIAATVLAQPANAIWIYNKHESAFDDGTLHIALSAAGGATPGGLGVRCSGAKIELMYIVMNSGVTSETADTANRLGGMKLKMRIDKGDIQEFTVSSDVSDDKYTVVTDIDKSVAEQMRDAKKSIAVTVSMMDQNFFENTFSSKGSTEVIGKALSLCEKDQATN